MQARASFAYWGDACACFWMVRPLIVITCYGEKGQQIAPGSRVLLLKPTHELAAQHGNLHVQVGSGKTGSSPHVAYRNVQRHGPAAVVLPAGAPILARQLRLGVARPLHQRHQLRHRRAQLHVPGVAHVGRMLLTEWGQQGRAPYLLWIAHSAGLILSCDAWEAPAARSAMLNKVRCQ